MNVRQSLILIIPLLLLNGCSILNLGGKKVDPLEVVTRAEDKPPLNLQFPSTLEPMPVKFYVVTQDNVDSVWEKLSKDKVDLVLFGVSDDGYEKLAVNLLELRNYIDKQRTIIIKYKEYYEPQKEEE